MAAIYSAFLSEITTALALELSGEPTYDSDVLSSKADAVIRELMQMRRYNKSSMTETQIVDDLENYYTQVINVTRYDFNTIGAEGEDTHSENGISRKFTERAKLWNGVTPLGRVIK